jgi:hypothetical protein
MDTEVKLIIGIFVALFLFIACVMGWGIYRNNIHGNKQFIDMKTRFNTAYILGDDGKFEKCRISAWNDYSDSDSVQVILDDGTPIYTHLRNVKLTNERE